MLAISDIYSIISIPQLKGKVMHFVCKWVLIHFFTFLIPINTYFKCLFIEFRPIFDNHIRKLQVLNCIHHCTETYNQRIYERLFSFSRPFNRIHLRSLPICSLVIINFKYMWCVSNQSKLDFLLLAIKP